MDVDKLYSFVFRGLLAENSLAKTGHEKVEKYSEKWEQETAKRLGLTLLDEELVAKARRMSVVYTAICALENSIREFIENKFKDESRDDWWETSVNEGIKKKAEARSKSEKDVRWLTPRGSSLLYYTEFGDLVSIIAHANNWALFEPHVGTVEWAKQIITTLEKSRNIIMHSGELSPGDIERVGMYIRDWVAQVG